MLFIKFEGWFQCRLATDPNPTDEPRGVSGYMKALPGEPDFDRIIRFHSPLVERAYIPKIGVTVTKVAIDGVENQKHHSLEQLLICTTIRSFLDSTASLQTTGSRQSCHLTFQSRKVLSNCGVHTPILRNFLMTS